MDMIPQIMEGIAKGIKTLYGLNMEADKVALQPTRKEFEGDYTIVVFPFTKVARKPPETIGKELGAYLTENLNIIHSFNVIKGFLNLSIKKTLWINFLEKIAATENYGKKAPTDKKVMVEFCSPNTNKPLHLGHIRNILLGWSISKIYEALGYKVIKTQIINDRGIAICRSMLAWQRFGNGETPKSAGLKGDHFVGKYYVKFSRVFNKEYAEWQMTDAAKKIYAEKKKGDQNKASFFKAWKNDYFNEYSYLGRDAKTMLIKWEANDPQVRALWKKMNAWVLAGFEETYESLRVHFDKLYYESNTYLLGKELIERGLAEGIMHRDGKRVWTNLENLGLAKKNNY